MPPISRLCSALSVTLVSALVAPAAAFDGASSRVPFVVTGRSQQVSIDVLEAGERPYERYEGYGGRMKTLVKPLALAEFVFTAEQGDHHIDVLGVSVNSTAGGNFGRVAFNHRLVQCWGRDFCSERYAFDFTYHYAMHEPKLSFHDNEYRIVGERVDRCEGSCIVSLGPPPAGHRFVLSGFEFDRLADDDRLVHRVTVMYEGNGNVRVRFQDDGNPAFSALVSGLWLPERAFVGPTKDVTLEYEPGKPFPATEVGLVAYALVGFDFEFHNGAHALSKFGLRYAPPNLIPRFADQNTDDPWRVRIKYAKLL